MGRHPICPPPSRDAPLPLPVGHPSSAQFEETWDTGEEMERGGKKGMTSDGSYSLASIYLNLRALICYSRFNIFRVFARIIEDKIKAICVKTKSMLIAAETPECCLSFF